MNKSRDLKQGFTLLELIVGMLILTIVGGLAMNAFINASKDFNQDKKTIDASQNLSAILEIIGNDIKQAGEQIGNSSFPVIEISQNNADSSTIIVRRALTTALTLCEPIAVGDPLRTRITVVNTDPASTPNCQSLSPIMEASNTPSPNILTQARNYRCKLGDPNADYSASTDYCATAVASNAANSALQVVRGAIADASGHIRTFTYTGEEDNSFVPGQYKLVVNAPALPPLSRHNVAYAVDSPVYLIEERQYTLSGENLTLSIDGGAANTLIKGISRFKVSAKGYTNTTDKVIMASPPAGIICTAADGVTIPATPSANDPVYGCRLNADDATAINWKQIAGVKVELQAKYDPTGRSATASAADLNKLTARAEFFPRNVLSK